MIAVTDITISSRVTSDGARSSSGMFIFKNVTDDAGPVNLNKKPLDRWVLIDFDFAEYARDGERGIDVAMGTEGYMAPEGYDRIRSTKSDIYSLGACVIDM